MSLLASRMLELRMKSDNLDKNTLRPTTYGATQAYMLGNTEAGGILTPQIQNASLTNIGRDLRIPVFDSQTVAIGTARPVIIADSENDSQLFLINYSTYSWGFTMTPSQHLNNELDTQADFERKYNKHLFQVLQDIENQCVGSLTTNKTQVFADLLNIYTNTVDTLVCPNGNKDEVIGDLSVIHNANDFFSGRYHIIGNAGIQSQVMKMGEHAVFNDQNKTIQFADKNFMYSNSIANAAGQYATGFCVPTGHLGVMFKHEAESVLGTKLANGTKWGKDTLVGTDIPVSTYEYTGAADRTALNGAASAALERVSVESYGFSIEVATVTAYNDDIANIANPIVKFAIAT